jgi:phage terminase large subunit
MGVALRQQVSDKLTGKKIEAHIFRGSESPDNPTQLYMPAVKGKKEIKGKTNKDTFVNKRAQYYTYLADRFYNAYQAVEKGKYIDPDTLISISSDIECIDELRAEICKIPRKDTGNGKIQILSKVDMAKKPYELPSPNLADSLMMSLDVPDIGNIENVELNFSSLW